MEKFLNQLNGLEGTCIRGAASTSETGWRSQSRDWRNFADISMSLSVHIPKASSVPTCLDCNEQSRKNQLVVFMLANAEEANRTGEKPSVGCSSFLLE